MLFTLYLYALWLQMKDKRIKKKIIKEEFIKKESIKDWSWKKEKLTSKKSKKMSLTSSRVKDASWAIQDSTFKIKIADLLNETGREDEIIFEHKFSEQLPNLDADGIAWTFTVQSLDSTSLLWTLSDVSARFHETCDSCGTSFLRTVDVPSYVARFVFEDEKVKKETDTTEEVLFFIDPKAETISIEDMVVQSILLNDPFVKRCNVCTKRLDDANDEEDLDEFTSKGNITFS